jgi:hypothetical protein
VCVCARGCVVLLLKVDIGWVFSEAVSFENEHVVLSIVFVLVISISSDTFMPPQITFFALLELFGSFRCLELAAFLNISKATSLRYITFTHKLAVHSF